MADVDELQIKINAEATKANNAIDRCFGGKKSKAEYIKEPILLKTFENDGLTEEEKQKQRELFVAKLQVMQTNFELSKKGQ